MTQPIVNGVAETKPKPGLRPIQTNYSGIPNTYSPTSTTAGGITNPYDEIIPHPDKVHHRNLVLCFDGTGDQFDADVRLTEYTCYNSNIVQFFSMLKRDDITQQMVYYQSGIGTYTIPEIAQPWDAALKKTLDMMFGLYLDAHIMAGGYEFLMQNFKTGDKIFIFGFSRGAYTARALAGMYIGLLPPCNHQQVPFAYKMYTREDDTGRKQSNQFKKTFSIDVDIEFVGVWDTVCSVGILSGRRLPFTRSNNHIRFFRHAISLDERRARFKVNLWNRPTEEDYKKGIPKRTMPRHKTPSHKKSLNDLEREFTDSDRPTDTEEVWFSGAHCDIGGGSILNGTRHALARIPLRWMVRQCFLLRTGILFHKTMFKDIGLDPDTLYPDVLPRPAPVPYTPDCLARKYKDPINFAANDGVTVKRKEAFINEEEEDLLDALTPIYDQLKLEKGWWILEVLPNIRRYQKEDDTWTHTLSINFGRPRIIPKQSKLGVKVHRSVKTRMDVKKLFKDKDYSPAAKWGVEPTWVD
ncbi:hypothetical protein PILCRDRAFT_75759 [Piloderma croceum F 1598]|uniref:T6SS Phospholipase effector Tle1-like catalytic domain-containing protein n=1 Tax=Piloderma croceum (strain F 1598) TaxID=765440 RepID=A0A0C3BM38_PILCF|nr:hypothetical protein PILCRDRAFT_75759 [Piloderma croceum F 1598]